MKKLIDRDCNVLSGFAKVGNLGGWKLVFGGCRGGPFTECLSRDESGRYLEASRETGNDESTLSQSHLQRL